MRRDLPSSQQRRVRRERAGRKRTTVTDLAAIQRRVRHRPEHLLGFRVFVFVRVRALALGPRNAGPRARKGELQDLLAAQQELRGGFRVKQLQRGNIVRDGFGMGIIGVGIGGCLVRLDQLLQVTVGVELGHDSAKAVATLHLALAKEGDRVAKVAETMANGGIIGGHGERSGTAFQEQLLHELLLALTRALALVRDLVEGGGIGGQGGGGGGGGRARGGGGREGGVSSGGVGGEGRCSGRGRVRHGHIRERRSGGGGRWGKEGVCHGDGRAAGGAGRT